jgi:hypothetical protein
MIDQVNEDAEYENERENELCEREDERGLAESKQAEMSHHEKRNEAGEVKKCVEESCAASQDVKCEDDVEDGDECGKHGDVVEEHEHVDLYVGP